MADTDISSVVYSPEVSDVQYHSPDNQVQSVVYHQAPEPNRAQKALDALVSGYKQAWSETTEGAHQGLQNIEGGAFDVANAGDAGQGGIGQAAGGFGKAGLGALQLLSAPFSGAIQGVHAAFEPAMAAYGMTPEQIEGSRKQFGILAGAALGAHALSPQGGALPLGEAEPGVEAANSPEGPRTPVVDPQTGETILKNPPMPQPIAAQLVDSYQAKGIDPTSTEEIKTHIAEREGLDPNLISVAENPEMPISKTDGGPEGLDIQLEGGGSPEEKLAMQEHEEGAHGPERMQGAPTPPEDNTAIGLNALAKENDPAAYADNLPGSGLPNPDLPKGTNSALDALNGASSGLDDLSRRADMAYEQRERISRTGTLASETREAFREAGEKPYTDDVAVATQDVNFYGTKLVQAGRALRAARMAPDLQDPASRLGLQMAMSDFEDATNQWNTIRFSAGRTVGAFNKALEPALGEMSGAELRDVSRMITKAQKSMENAQLFRQAVGTRALQNLMTGNLADAAKLGVQAMKIGLLSPLGFLAGAFTSAYRGISEAGGAFGRDLGFMTRGHWGFPNFGSYFSSLVDSFGENKLLPDEIRSQMYGSVAGEEMASGGIGSIVDAIKKAPEQGIGAGNEFDLGPGRLTYRQNIPSVIADTLGAGASYLRTAVHGAAGELAATVRLRAMAETDARLGGLEGAAKDAYIQDYLQHPPDYAYDTALRVGQENAMNIPEGQFTKWEQAYNSSMITKLFIKAFAQFDGQAIRMLGDSLGIRPSAWVRVAQDGWQREDILETIGRGMTGWGSLMLARHLYNSIDYNDMTMVVPGYGRIRLSMSHPLPDLFTTYAGLMAIGHAAGMNDDDKAISKFLSGIKFTSIPGVSALASYESGLQGILSPSVKTGVDYLTQGKKLNVSRAVQQMTEQANAFFPGTTIMGAMKSLMDPVSREGWGNNVPWYSSTLPAKIDPTTGEENIPEQRTPVQLPMIGDVRFNALQGAPLRGMIRDTSGVYELLDYYNPESILHSGIRTPFGDVDVHNIPTQYQDEFKQIFGRYRQQLFTSKDQGALVGQFEAGRIAAKGTLDYQLMQKKIKMIDAACYNAAIKTMIAKYGPSQPKLIKDLSMMQEAGASVGYKPDPLPQAPEEPDPFENPEPEETP